MLQIARFCGSLKVTVFLLVAFLLVIFWGVLGQVSMGMDVGTERFFGSFFVWVFDVIPVKKESIALPLLRQLFGELSASARETP